jgi:hypothetical protein
MLAIEQATYVKAGNQLETLSRRRLMQLRLEIREKRASGEK